MSFSTYAYPPPKFPNERYTYSPASPPQALLPILPPSSSRNIAPELSLRSSSREPAFTTHHAPSKHGTPESELVLEGFELYKHSAPCAFPRSRPGSIRPAGKAREDVFGDVTGVGIGSSSGSKTRVQQSDDDDNNNKPKDTELDTKKARRKRAISQASSRATKLRRESERLTEEDVRRRTEAERGQEAELEREPSHYLAVDRWVRKSTNTNTKTKTKPTRAPGVTFVCLHANGFHKEMWIPTLQELLAFSSSGSEGSGTSKIGDARSSSSTGTTTSTSTTDRDGNSSTAKEQTETDAEAEVEIDEILLVDIYNHAESYLLNDGRVGLVFDWQDVVSLRSPSFVSFLNARDMGETMMDESPCTKFPLHSGLSCLAISIGLIGIDIRSVRSKLTYDPLLHLLHPPGPGHDRLASKLPSTPRRPDRASRGP